MAAAAIPAIIFSSLMSASAQRRAGKIAAEESEINASLEEVAATQREADRKDTLARALATANAQAGAAGVRAFEGSPLTVLNESIEFERKSTGRDAFNSRISALTQRARGRNARSTANFGALTTLVSGVGQAAAAA